MKKIFCLMIVLLMVTGIAFADRSIRVIGSWPNDIEAVGFELGYDVYGARKDVIDTLDPMSDAVIINTNDRAMDNAVLALKDFVEAGGRAVVMFYSYGVRQGDSLNSILKMKYKIMLGNCYSSSLIDDGGSVLSLWDGLIIGSEYSNRETRISNHFIVRDSGETIGTIVADGQTLVTGYKMSIGNGEIVFGITPMNRDANHMFYYSMQKYENKKAFGKLCEFVNQ